MATTEMGRDAKPRQSTSTVMMVRPVAFAFNEETAATNVFQAQPGDGAQGVQQKAVSEFDSFVQLLRNHGINVTVFEDTRIPATPDSLFPNNWISVDSQGTVVLYPMCAPNRRHEREHPEVLAGLRHKFELRNVVDLTGLEAENEFLEGTGAIVADWVNKILYIARSPRATLKAIETFHDHFPDFKLVMFDAVDGNAIRIYHTNVMMAVGSTWVVVCLGSVHDSSEKKLLLDNFQATGKEVIEITEAQMRAFACNVLELQSSKHQPLIVMSLTGWKSLTSEQQKRFKTHGIVVTPSIPTIESIGGGSARCMIAEIFAPVRT